MHPFLSTEPKTTVSARLEPELVELLKAEAESAGAKSLSAHLEAILLNRQNADVDVSGLKNQLARLDAENAALREQLQNDHFEGDAEVRLAEKEAIIRALKQEKMELQKGLRQLLAQRDALAKSQIATLPFWLSEKGHDQLCRQLRVLQQAFPKRTLEELLIQSATTARLNLDPFAFRVHTLRNAPPPFSSSSKS